MKILFDQGTPVPLRFALANHSVATAFEKGWSDLNNGDLLREAEKEFDLFITTDKNLEYQQNLAKRKIAVLVLPTASWPKIKPHQNKIAAAVDNIKPRAFVALDL